MKSINYFLFFIIILSVLLLNSCGDDCSEKSSEFSWTQNKSIEIDTKGDSTMINDSLIYFVEYSITDGSSNLFEYVDFFEACEDISDTGGSSNFSMIIPTDSTESFSYIDQEIMETSAFLRLYSFGGTPLHSVEEGEISGTKLDDGSWRIFINVVTKPLNDSDNSESESITIDEIFTLQ